MSEKIPFLNMFSCLQRRQDLAEAVVRWQIVSASIDKTALSVRVEVEGAVGAGPNLLRDAEDGICKAYGLNSAKIVVLESAKPEIPMEKAPIVSKSDQKKVEQKTAAPKSLDKPSPDAFSRTEAIRQAAMHRAGASAPVPKAEKKGSEDSIFGKPIGKPAIPIGELELDMGTVVIEGDVFAVDNKELKKRGAWVVAFDVTDYTGSIRVNKFFPGEEGKPLVDKIKKGMHLKIQGR